MLYMTQTTAPFQHKAVQFVNLEITIMAMKTCATFEFVNRTGSSTGGCVLGFYKLFRPLKHANLNQPQHRPCIAFLCGLLRVRSCGGQVTR